MMSTHLINGRGLGIARESRSFVLNVGLMKMKIMLYVRAYSHNSL